MDFLLKEQRVGIEVEIRDSIITRPRITGNTTDSIYYGFTFLFSLNNLVAAHRVKSVLVKGNFNLDRKETQRNKFLLGH